MAAAALVAGLNACGHDLADSSHPDGPSAGAANDDVTGDEAISDDAHDAGTGGTGGANERPPNTLLDTSGEYFVGVTPQELVFETFVPTEGSVPQVQSLDVDFNGDGVFIGFAAEVEAPSWLFVYGPSKTTDPGPFKLDIAAQWFNQEVGEYETSLRFAGGSLEEARTVYVDLPIRFNVGPTPTVFDGEVLLEPPSTATEPPPPRTLALDFDGYDVEFTATLLSGDRPADWLEISVDEPNASLELSVPERLEAGAYDASIRVEFSGMGSRAVVEIPVRYEVEAVP